MSEGVTTNSVSGPTNSVGGGDVALKDNPIKTTNRLYKFSEFIKRKNDKDNYDNTNNNTKL